MCVSISVCIDCLVCPCGSWLAIMLAFGSYSSILKLGLYVHVEQSGRDQMCVCLCTHELRRLHPLKYTCTSSMSVYFSHALIYTAQYSYLSLSLSLSLARFFSPSHTHQHTHSCSPAAVYCGAALDGSSVLSASSFMLNESYCWCCSVK